MEQPDHSPTPDVDLEELKSQISQLPPHQQSELVNWLMLETLSQGQINLGNLAIHSLVFQIQNLTPQEIGQMMELVTTTVDNHKLAWMVHALAQNLK